MNLMNEIILYKPPIRIIEYDLIVRGLLILSMLTSTIMYYYARCVNMQKKTSEQMQLIRDSIMVSRLDSMDAKLEKAHSDIVLLGKLYPEMNERTVTIGDSTATWHVPFLYYSDTIIVNYNIVDLATDSIVKSGHAEYACLNVVKYLNRNTEITIPSGAVLIVTKAVRIARWYNNSTIPRDITEEAKIALQSKSRC